MKRRFIAILLTCTMIFSLSLAATPSGQTDEEYTIMDALEIMMYLADLDNDINDDNMHVYNLVDDGVLDITDALYIMLMIAELEDMQFKPAPLRGNGNILAPYVSPVRLHGYDCFGLLRTLV